MKIKSAHVKSPWKFKIREVKLQDELASDHALISIQACGICGTDLSTAAYGANEWKPFGHEIAGVIEKIAPGGHLRTGDPVVLESSSFCGRCSLCRNGRVDLCNKGINFWGQPAMGFSEKMLAPVCCLVHREKLAADAASLVEPAGIAYDLVRTAEIRPGDRVCLIGPGPIGLMAIPLALRTGASQVVCVGRSHSRRRLEVAGLLGAEPMPCDRPFQDVTGLHKHFDHVLLTAPVDQIAPALSLLDYGGKLTFIGIGNGDGMIHFDVNDFHFRKLQLRSSFASPALYYPAVIKLLASGIIPSDLIISHRFPLKDIAEAMRVAREDKTNAVKVIIES